VITGRCSLWINVTCRVESSAAPTLPNRSSASPTPAIAVVTSIRLASAREAPRTMIASSRPSKGGPAFHKEMGSDTNYGRRWSTAYFL
jgi:hypothetical protein